MTKASTEVFNEQPDPDRRYYEVQGLTRLVLSGSYDAVYARMDLMLDVIRIIETSRK